MGFWDLFKVGEQETTEEKNGGIYNELKLALPDGDDDELIKTACLAGLMARVAYVDMNVDEQEKETMIAALNKWTNWNEKQVRTIAEVAIRQIKNLAGLENHKYTQQLREMLSSDDKYRLLLVLFQIAAADGNASNFESEEIRIISKGLLLPEQHYLAARATMSKHLGALK